MILGPRQAGKTTLAKMLAQRYDYFNYDNDGHRVALRKKDWDRKKELVIFDELHKMKGWKSWLKGIFDVEGTSPGIIVTGSARLDLLKKTGDSLAGRFFQFRLHPLDVKEASSVMGPEEALARLMSVSGFPEPFLANDAEFYRRWKAGHLDVILREDLIDLIPVRDIRSIGTLVELLRSRVGTPVSYASLSRDLERDPNTVRRWLTNLEMLNVIFAVRPYHRNIARSILKEPKYYFYDSAHVTGDDGAKLENITACALIKEIDRLRDCHGIRGELFYLRNKEKKEIDFAVALDNEVRYLIEVKASEVERSPNFNAFLSYFPKAHAVQLVHRLDRERTYPDGLAVRALAQWLNDLTLTEGADAV